MVCGLFIAAKPQCHDQLGKSPVNFAAVRVFLSFEENVADGQVPILIDVVGKVVFELRQIKTYVELLYFHFTREERGVGARQLIPQFHSELDYASLGDGLLIRKIVAALGLPPGGWPRGFARFAIELHPRSIARQGKFKRELAA